ncbi:MAG: PAS domain S-box protein [Reichenbachiella sp.]|uniref:PAS domain S-box protein n=1 Tax=Reichenbachiella sp. TaxID=2184521 RepID=UPI00326331A7
MRDRKEKEKEEEVISRFLILEDEKDDLKLTLRSIEKDKIQFTYRAVDSRKGFVKELKEFDPHIIIADYNLPDYSGMQALKWASEKRPDIPFIFVTGSLGEENAVETLKQGASDFVLKGNLIRLPMTIRRALTEAESHKEKILAQKAFLTAESRYQQLIENVPVGICELDLKGHITSINKQASNIFGFKKNNTKLSELLDEYDSDQLNTWLKSKINGTAFNGAFHSRSRQKLIDLTLIPHIDMVTGSKRLIGVSQDITNRSKMEQELRDKNTLMEGLLEAIPDSVFLKDKKLKYLMVNKSFLKATGKKLNEVLNKKDEDFIEIEMANKYKKADEEVISSGELVTTMHSHRNDNNETLFFDTHKNPILDGKKQVIGIVGVSRNVTASIKAQEKMKQSESMLLEAENVANMGSWEFRITDENIICSIGAAQMLNVQLSDRTLKYKSFLKFCHSLDRPAVISGFKRAILDGESFMVDHRIIQGDGSILWFQTKGKPYQNQSGNIDKIVGTVQDVTEQKRNQEKLEKSKMLLKEAQSIANVGSFDWDITQNILRSSEVFTQILQIGHNDIWLTFENYLERIHPLDRELTRKKIYDALSTATTYDVEHRILLPDKSVKTVRAIGKFKTDNQGQPESLFGTIQDVSDKKKAETALLEGQEIERARIAREVHDGIGQLLAATKFNLSALDGMPEEVKEKHIDKIHNTLEMTIDEARRITRNLSTKVLEELGFERAAQELCTEASELKAISFDIKIEANEEDISEKMKTTIYRILQESVNNMVKYSEAKNASIELVKKENHLHLAIADDGKGFDIADPKHRKGNGLSNLDQRAKSLHGYLDIQSSPGKGTVIQVKIPFENNPNL